MDKHDEAAINAAIDEIANRRDQVAAELVAKWEADARSFVFRDPAAIFVERARIAGLEEELRQLKIAIGQLNAEIARRNRKPPTPRLRDLSTTQPGDTITIEDRKWLVGDAIRHYEVKVVRRTPKRAYFAKGRYTATEGEKAGDVFPRKNFLVSSVVVGHAPKGE